MPTNVTAEYKKAEEAYRKAREPRERLDCLREMLRTIPKHKGTDHLQADIKTRIKQLTGSWRGRKKAVAALARPMSYVPKVPHSFASWDRPMPANPVCTPG
jgi:hypothetical protein